MKRTVIMVALLGIGVAMAMQAGADLSKVSAVMDASLNATMVQPSVMLNERLNSVTSNLSDGFRIDLRHNAGSMSVVPEPSSMLLLGMGLSGLVYSRLRRRQRVSQ